MFRCRNSFDLDKNFFLFTIFVNEKIGDEKMKSHNCDFIFDEDFFEYISSAHKEEILRNYETSYFYMIKIFHCFISEYFVRNSSFFDILSNMENEKFFFSTKKSIFLNSNEIHEKYSNLFEKEKNSVYFTHVPITPLCLEIVKFDDDIFVAFFNELSTMKNIGKVSSILNEDRDIFLSYSCECSANPLLVILKLNREKKDIEILQIDNVEFSQKMNSNEFLKELHRKNRKLTNCKLHTRFTVKKRPCFFTKNSGRKDIFLNFYYRYHYLYRTFDSKKILLSHNHEFLENFSEKIDNMKTRKRDSSSFYMTCHIEESEKFQKENSNEKKTHYVIESLENRNFTNSLASLNSLLCSSLNDHEIFENLNAEFLTYLFYFSPLSEKLSWNTNS